MSKRALFVFVLFLIGGTATMGVYIAEQAIAQSWDGYGQIELPEEAQTFFLNLCAFDSELNLKEGQVTNLPGTGLTIQVREVRDFTSEGCLGGPVGCRDYVQLEVTQEKESKEIVLYAAHTQFEREQGVNQANVFGYKVVLKALKGKEVALRIGESK